MQNHTEYYHKLWKTWNLVRTVESIKQHDRYVLWQAEKEEWALIKGERKNMNKRYIKKLYSRESLKTMSKSKKKLYKLLLVALSANLFKGKMLHGDSKEIVSELEKLLEEDYPSEYYNHTYEHYNNYLSIQLENDEIIKFNESNYEDMISFTREILEDLSEKNVAVYKRETVEKYIDVRSYIKNIDDCVNLIGVGFETGIYPFSPEKLIWSDFKILWNFFATYQKETLDDWSKAVDYGLDYERIYDKRSLELQFITGTMERYVLVSCITFVESFLYNIRMVIINNPVFEDRIKESNVSVLKNDKITDKQIIEDVLYKIYPDLKKNIEKEYQIYKELLKLRDKYIHISVRMNGEGQPDMNEIVSSAGLNIEMKIKYIMDLVYKINEVILKTDGLNILWWKRDEECNFVELELFKIT